MHAAAFHVLRTAQRQISTRACRTIAGTRCPLPRRNFHRSAIAYQVPDEPPPGENDRYDVGSEHRQNGQDGPEAKDEGEHPPREAQRENTTSARSGETEEPENTDVETSDSVSRTAEGEWEAISLQAHQPGLNQGKNDELMDETNQQVDMENWALSQRRQTRIGSGRIRSNRSRKPEGLPPVVLPEWFFSKNVTCAGHSHVSTGSLAVYSGENTSEGTIETPQSEDLTDCDLPTTQNAKYTIHVDVYREILAAAKSGLALRPPRNIPLSSIPRPLVHLQCPKDGGTLYLDSIVETVADKLGADLVRLDADDIAQLIGTYVDENLAWSWSKTALLGYDAQKVAGKLEDYEKDPSSTEDDLEAEDENPISRLLPLSSFLNRANRSRNKPSFVISGSNSPLATLLSAARSQPRNSALSENIAKFEVFSPQSDANSPLQMKSASDQWLDLKVSAVLDALVGAADAKRSMSSIGATDETAQNSASTPVIVHVKDFKELNGIPDGADVLRKLRYAINKRWFDGRPMIMFGTTSTEEAEPALSKPEIQFLQSDMIDGEKRTIFVPPDRRQEQDDVFEADEKARIRGINIRHIEDMIMKLAGGNLYPSLTVNIENGLDTATAFSSDLNDHVWAYPRVHRLATTIVGLETSFTNIDGAVFTRAWKLLEASDEAKFAWGAAELKEEDDGVEAMLQESKDSSHAIKDKIKKIRSEATTHEKKLLGGVIMPSDIHTTFSDVLAPKETVEALKTLTSLSLIRPEAFSYGVLATDKIPGLLLYGPPGTGKTLLAKAVAKESGATVLEVSGAEVSDMYVGEGEKNVKAIFSLAKKLSPCVVFIDEADSLLGSRSGEASKRSSHREVINQFLREWDGLKDLSAFIMVATNRPFDLDDAVLRRLPRRLLVDLPVEKDREAILKIHLKDEILHESVSLAKLAKDTPFYSGSDLKNVSVAAAMACIREENEVASKHTGEEPYMYPPKRILMEHHFRKALDEISASISDDMSTLSAIRKFDEKYGDRRGRRKKAANLGFGGTTVPEKDSDAARVRKLDLSS
jgi:SpoVK/Ycf46/Vps4 family AAA+-type ATPase